MADPAMVPGMVDLGDRCMSLRTFMQMHGSAMAAFPDAYIAIELPPWDAPEAPSEVKASIKSVVTAVTGILAALVVKGNGGKVAGAAAGGYLADHAINWFWGPHRSRTTVIQVRDLLDKD